MATGTLTGQTIANTYKALLKITGTTAGGETLHATTQKVIEDGDGNPFPFSAAQDAILMTGTSRIEFNDAGEYISGDGTDLTITSSNDIKLAVGAAGSVHSAGVAGTSNTVLGVDAGIGLEAGSNYNVFIGDLTGDSSLNDAIWNVGVGYAALSSLTTGDRNTAVGYQALTTCSTGEENVAIGRGSLDAAVSASYNIAIGTNALGTVDDGETFNIAIGYDAMGNANLSNIDSNIAIGGYALDAIGANAQTGTIGIGHEALSALTSGVQNTVVGYQAADVVTTAAYNTVLGYGAFGAATTSADQNVVVGRNAMSGAIGAEDVNFCVVIGDAAAADALTAAASGTVAVGKDALAGLTSGSGNTAVGYQAGAAIVSGIENTIVGYQAHDVGLGDGNVAIGKAAMGSMSHATSDKNTAVGSYALLSTGANAVLGATAIGNSALLELTCAGGAGQYNTAVGYFASANITTGEGNTTLGYNALVSANSDETHNTCVGYAAGQNIDGGDRNTCIGSITVTSATTANDQIVIGFNFAGTADSAVHIGNATRHIRCDFGSDQTWDAGSDERIKTVTGDSPLGLDFINDFPIITYTWKSASEYPEEFKDYDAGKTEPSDTLQHHGVTAQSVKAALDNVDGVTDFSGWDEDPDGMQTIGEAAFVWPLIKAVQELTAKVKALEDAQ